MKKFITRVVLFLLLVAVCDYAIGALGDYTFNHQKGGMNRKTKEIRDLTEPDIVILGSSRAEHHYISDMMTDSLGAATYNMGVDGNGILLMYPYLSRLLTRHTPEVVIYDILPSFDLYDENYEKYLTHLVRLEGIPEADSIMNQIDPTIRYKQLSRIYPYNSGYPSLLKGWLKPDDSYSHGFIPIDGTLPSDNPPTLLEGGTYSQLKLDTFDRFVSLCRNNDILLIITISPFYGEFSASDLEYIRKYCTVHGLPFIDYSRHPEFSASPGLFADTYHLNREGTGRFTTLICDTIASLYNQRSQVR